MNRVRAGGCDRTAGRIDGASRITDDAYSRTPSTTIITTSRSTATTTTTISCACNAGISSAAGAAVTAATTTTESGIARVGAATTTRIGN